MVIFDVCIVFTPSERKNIIKSQKKVWSYCNTGDTKILDFNQYQKSVKAPFVIYAYLECFIKR